MYLSETLKNSVATQQLAQKNVMRIPFFIIYIFKAPKNNYF